jgi:hypothetical protein
LASKKKTTAMEFWKKTRKKKTKALGALEKNHKFEISAKKKITTTMEFSKKPRRRRP